MLRTATCKPLPEEGGSSCHGRLLFPGDNRGSRSLVSVSGVGFPGQTCTAGALEAAFPDVVPYYAAEVDHEVWWPTDCGLWFGTKDYHRSLLM